MKKFLYTFLFLGVIGLGAVDPLAQRALAACDPANTSCVDTPANTAAAATSATKSDTTAENTPTAAPAPAIPSDGVFVTVMSYILQLFAWLLGVAAITLDNAVYYTVVTMGSVVNGLAAIGVTWRILRDIGNIALIFGFLAIGMSIILDTEKLGYGKKMLPTLLFVAVTLNFSLFVAEAVIDVSNLFATQFYTQINGGNMAQPTDYYPGTINKEGISGKIMSQLGLQTIFSNVSKNPLALAAHNSVTISFMGIILFLVTAFVFFSLAFVLIFRFVALVLLIVSSPVGFAGLAVPKLESVAHKWWSELLNQAISAPVLLLLLYVALAVITDKSFMGGFGATSDGWLGFVGGESLQSFAGTILSFIIAMGLLLSVTVVAKKIGAAGADKAMKWAGKASFGVAATLGRNTFGRTSQGLSRAWSRNELSRSTYVGRLAAGALDRGAKAGFDVRGTGALKQLPGGVDAGDVHKGGYRATEDATIKAKETYAKSLKLTKLQEEAKERAEAALKDAQARLNDAKKTKNAGKIVDAEIALGEAQKALTAAENKAQMDYAENIKNSFTGRLYTNRAAVKNIEKDAKKSKSDRENAKLQKLIEKAKDNIDAGAAPSPAASAPAAGAAHS
ncbi:MAG: hypothetical protein WC030_01745 [Candidatus Paceibacterota bacterium]